jgi:hypothetical protein
MWIGLNIDLSGGERILAGARLGTDLQHGVRTS